LTYLDQKILQEETEMDSKNRIKALFEQFENEFA